MTDQPRNRPFQTIEELDAYVGGPRIQCLECGRWYKALATHIPRTHHMTHDDYREKWGIPRRYPLAGTGTREKLSAQMRDYIDSGRLTHEHLPSAVEAARQAKRQPKLSIDADRHRKIIRKRRPGDYHKLPAGSKTASGRDADRRREYQIAYRAMKQGDSSLMQRYIRKYKRGEPESSSTA